MKRKILSASVAFVIIAAFGPAQAGAPPSVSDVQPSRAPSYGGHTVTILGNKFQPGATVLFGTAPAATVTFVSASQLEVVTPFTAKGVVDVHVTNPDGKAATWGGFEFVYSGDGVYEIQDALLPVDDNWSRELLVGDMDGDGDTDVMIANVQYQQNRLYLNDGVGNFVDVTATHMPSETPSFFESEGGALGDVDGDGDLDAVLVNFNQQNRLYLNDGRGIFADETAGRLPPEVAWSFGADFGDVDNDGDLDLIIANNGSQNRLYLNDGTGIFTDASGTNLPADVDRSFDIEFADADGDGTLDIFVANGAQNRLYRNNGAGVFSDVTVASLPSGGGSSKEIETGDIDGDGDMDFVVANYSGPNALYVNDGTGVFSDVTANQLGIPYNSCQDAALGDIDGDGDLDLFFAQDYSQQQYRLYVNDGNGTFTDVTANRIAINSDYGEDAEFADIDLDGDLDVLVGHVGQNHVYVNVRAQDTEPPSVPNGLAVTAVACNQIDLAWDPSTDNVGVTGYTVYRDGVEIGATPAMPYSDTTVAENTAYAYTVDAYDAAGNRSAPSVPANETTPACSAATMHIQSIDFATRWEGSTEHLDITVLVTDGAGAAVEGATVSGELTPPDNKVKSFEDLTGPDGRVVFPYKYKNNNPLLTGDHQFCVTDVTHANYAYDALLNVETCDVFTDDDHDGVPNELDLCPDTPLGEPVDANGCTWEQLDDDGDGLTNGDEVNTYGTDPNLADTDADGLEDGAEVTYWGAGWDQDPDGDGLANLVDADSENDKMLDGWEVANSLDPVSDDSALDPDGDVVSNFVEYKIGTDPNDPADTPATVIHYQYDSTGGVQGANSVVDDLNP